ncbi:MetQ/NlpA family ABC transporter substrate-binding protein [Fructobacillus fructosus]|uniref:MetQ/NlpA family ABC transporter substrate-binding protein n=1 Tax=Fructobacillus fructosus TaxID=1631 RepID=UPI00200A6E36|nr:MetQ/NlpA family ABC transporter substrate-binding protein [Fructobacillus fructosus]
MNLKIKTFTDYTQPNAALTSGDIDVNAFQHYIFLNDWNKAHKSDIVPVGETIIVAGRLYSDKHKNLSEIPNGGTVAISNSKITQGRTLLLLQAAGLTTIADGVKDPTLKDITDNPKNLQFKEVGTDQLVRVLSEVDLASVDPSFIVGSGRSIKSAIYVRPIDKSQHDGINIIATTKAKKNSQAIKKFVKAPTNQTTLPTISTIRVARAKSPFGKEPRSQVIQAIQQIKFKKAGRVKHSTCFYS